MYKIVTLLYLIGITASAVCQTVDFTYQSTTGFYCTPATVKFTKISTGSPTGYVWTFGNNSGSNSANPTTVFTTAGTYTVRLIVIYKKYTLQVTKTITINPAVAAHIESDRNKLCMPGVVNFTSNAGENITKYEWDFGTNTGIVSTTSPYINHSFPDYTVYPVSMKAIASSGCSGQSFTSITIERPSLTASVSSLSGCIPATINFNANVGLLPSSSVTNYKWNFADGSAQTSTTVANATHIYNATGNYMPALHIITNEGCTNDFSFPELAFGKPPTNHIAYPKKTVFCGSEAVGFVSKAINANKYLWDFGEGDTTYVMDTVINHRFRSLGTKTITVTPLFNDCPGTPISFTVNVIGVIAGYDYSNTCTNATRFTFTNLSQGNQSSRIWTFGDGTPALSTANVVHIYPDTGTFNTKLTVADNITGCSDTYARNIYTAIPSLLNSDSSICRNSNTTFSIYHNYNNPDALYSWNVVGMQLGPDNTLPLNVHATVLGHFNNNYVVIDNGPQYCPDTVKFTGDILVRGPQLAFTAPAEICLSKSCIINNSSFPYVPTDLINNWHWDYNIPGLTVQQEDIYQPAPHFFPYWGTYDIKITAVDIQGCMDTLVKQVRVFDVPFLRTIPDVDTLCAGQVSTLIAFHNDTITWSPAISISCNHCDTVTVSPPTTTTYYVTATNRFNCSVTDSILIHVYERFTAVAAKAENFICANESVKLDISPKDKLINWSPVEGLSDTTIFNPLASPKHSTRYHVVLTDSVGCFSSSTDVNVNVKSNPTVNAGPDRLLPYNTSFSLAPLYSSNVRSYEWSPAVLLDCNNCSVPAGLSTNSTTYTITVTSDSGCVAKDKIAVMVECKGANLLFPTAFTPNRDNINDYFYPVARGIKKILKFAIYSREGILVYEARDFYPNEKIQGWDGNYRGVPQSTSTYVYIAEAICDAGETISAKGSVVLLR